MAPSAPAMPKRSRPPSKAGPAGLDAATMRSPSLTTISVLVPMSMSRLVPRLGGEVGGDQVGRHVPAHVAGDERRAHHAPLRMHEEAQLVGTAGDPGGVGLAPQHGQLGDRLVGHLADGLDVEVEEQVAHRGVGHDHRLVDLVAVDAALLVDLLETSVERAAQRLAQGAGVGALVRDSAHHVAAAEALRVLEGAAADDGPAGEVDEPEDDGGGADVDGQAEDVLATQIEGDAVVEDGALVGGDDGVDVGDGLAGVLQDAHAAADDGELDIALGRLDVGLAGEAEALGKVRLCLGTGRQRLGPLADLDGALAAAPGTSARLGHSERDLVGIVEDRLAHGQGAAIDAVDDLGHVDSSEQWLPSPTLPKSGAWAATDQEGPSTRFGILHSSLASGQTVRHLTLDQGIEGSNPSSPAIPFPRAQDRASSPRGRAEPLDRHAALHDGSQTAGPPSRIPRVGPTLRA